MSNREPPASYRREKLLEIARGVTDSIIAGLEELDPETRRRIMRRGGEACAAVGDLGVAERIAEETSDVNEVIEKANDRIAWCGRWTREGDKITAVCTECGCPLVRNGLLSLTGTFCYCSLGWVRAIFKALLRKPVKVELEKAIGFGDDICEFVVSI